MDDRQRMTPDDALAREIAGAALEALWRLSGDTPMEAPSTWDEEMATITPVIAAALTTPPSTCADCASGKHRTNAEHFAVAPPATRETSAQFRDRLIDESIRMAEPPATSECEVDGIAIRHACGHTTFGAAPPATRREEA